MSNKELVPEIRFEGFDGEWTKATLPNVAQITMGQSPSGKNYTSNPNDHILVQGNADMKDGEVNPRVWTTEVTKTGLVGDIIISVRAPVGDVGKTKYDVVLGRGVAGIRANDFIYYQLERLKKNNFWEKVSTGSTFQSINSDSLKKIELIIPIEEEQRYISSLLNEIDNNLRNKKKQLSQLKNFKQAMLQKMFPKEGEKEPELRFEGFKGEWEEQKLGSIMDITSVKRIHQSDWTETGVRFLRARDIVAASKNEEPSELLYISNEKYELYSNMSGRVQIEDLLVTGVGTIGVPFLIKNNSPLYFKDGNIIWFKNKGVINGYFLYYSFIGEEIQEYIRGVSGRGTVGTYTIQSGKKTPIMLPSYEEQQLIGEYFQTLDENIQAKQKELEKLKQFKQAMLQKMFV